MLKIYSYSYSLPFLNNKCTQNSTFYIKLLPAPSHYFYSVPATKKKVKEKTPLVATQNI